jgi:hypothetical protein
MCPADPQTGKILLIPWDRDGPLTFRVSGPDDPSCPKGDGAQGRRDSPRRTDSPRLMEMEEGQAEGNEPHQMRNLSWMALPAYCSSGTKSGSPHPTYRCAGTCSADLGLGIPWTESQGDIQSLASPKQRSGSGSGCIQGRGYLTGQHGRTYSGRLDCRCSLVIDVRPCIYFVGPC